jgi:hypothetical protein
MSNIPPLYPNVKCIKAFYSRLGLPPTFYWRSERGAFRRDKPRLAAMAKSIAWFNSTLSANCYFTLNPIPAGERRIRDNVQAHRGVVVDVDDCGNNPDVLRDIPAFVGTAPTCTVFTGGGLQFLWLWPEPLGPDLGAAKNRALVYDIAGQFPNLNVDKKCHSAEHLWRIPGTVNIRRQRLAEVVQWDWASRLDPETIVSAPVVSGERSTISLFAVDDVTAQEITDIFPVWLVSTLTEADAHADRSDQQFTFIRKAFEQLGINQYTVDLIAACLMAPADLNDGNLISHCTRWARINEQFVPRSEPPEEFAARQIANWLRINEETIDA